MEGSKVSKMKFREYDNLKPIILTADSDTKLEVALENVGNTYNIIDLQFSTDVVKDLIKGQVILYHALLLVEEKQ